MVLTWTSESVDEIRSNTYLTSFNDRPLIPEVPLYNMQYKAGAFNITIRK